MNPVSLLTHRLHVKGMSCQHCVQAVTKAIRSLDADATVDVDLPSGEVVVKTVLSLDAAAQAISDEGYEVQV